MLLYIAIQITLLKFLCLSLPYMFSFFLFSIFISLYVYIFLSYDPPYRFWLNTTCVNIYFFATMYIFSLSRHLGVKSSLRYKHRLDVYHFCGSSHYETRVIRQNVLKSKLFRISTIFNHCTPMITILFWWAPSILIQCLKFNFKTLIILKYL